MAMKKELFLMMITTSFNIFTLCPYCSMNKMSCTKKNKDKTHAMKWSRGALIYGAAGLHMNPQYTHNGKQCLFPYLTSSSTTYHYEQYGDQQERWLGARSNVGLNWRGGGVEYRIDLDTPNIERKQAGVIN